MNFPGPTAYSVPGFGTGENTRGDSPLTYVAVYAATSTRLALHHRHRALIVLHRARADEREDVVVARLLHRVALVEDLRVVVLEHEPAPVDPAQAVAELHERVDRTVDTGRRHGDDTRLVGDDTDRDRRVGDTPVGGAVRRTAASRTPASSVPTLPCHRRDRAVVGVTAPLPSAPPRGGPLSRDPQAATRQRHGDEKYPDPRRQPIPLCAILPPVPSLGAVSARDR